MGVFRKNHFLFSADSLIVKYTIRMHERRGPSAIKTARFLFYDGAPCDRHWACLVQLAATNAVILKCHGICGWVSYVVTFRLVELVPPSLLEKTHYHVVTTIKLQPSVPFCQFELI